MPITERDFELLNSYVDGRLTQNERAVLESRLVSDTALKAELESLRATVGLLKMAERVRAPRSFTLDPQVYGKPARSSFWQRWGVSALTPLASAGAALAVLMILGGGFVMTASFGSLVQRAAAPAPVAQEQGADAFMAAEATEAATEASAESLMTAADAGTPAADSAGVAAAGPAAAGPNQAAAPIAPGAGGGAGGGLPPDSGGVPSPQPTAAAALPPSTDDGSRYGGAGPAAGNIAADQAPGAAAPKAGPGETDAGAAEAIEAAPESAQSVPVDSVSVVEPAPVLPLMPLLGGGLVLAGIALLAVIFIRRRA